MTESRYDVIVVGARCAGSPTAMLLARKGHRVLVLDRATFPSDAVSTHLIHPPGVAALRSWGLLEALAATRCPPIGTFMFDFGPVTISGAPGTADSPVAYAPRRTVLDKLLVDAAAEAGAEVREGFSVTEIVVDDGSVVGIRGHGKGGRSVTERAQVVVGADGLHSLVARTVRPARYHEKPPLTCGYYSYWSGLSADGRVEMYLRPDRAMVVIPTHDGLTIVAAVWPFAEFATNRTDVEVTFLSTLELVPGLADRVRAAERQERFAGMAVPNFFRMPFGPGWALVGDAGYIKDFNTGQGITDAFRDAGLCAAALDETFCGARSFEAAMADYQATRDRHVLAMYEFTTQLATLEPPSPELQLLLGAMPGNQAAMDGFARVIAGVTSPAEFFAEANVGRILAATG